MTWSIRTRLASYFSLLVGVILLAHSLALYAVISYSLEKQFRRDLVHEAHWIAEVVVDRERAGKLDSLPMEMRDLDADVRVLSPDGHVIFDSGTTDWSAYPYTPTGSGSPETGALWKHFSVDGISNDVLTDVIHVPKSRPLVVQMIASHQDVVALKQTFSFWILILVPVAMGLAVIAGFFYARKALAPIEVLRRKADGITAQTLGERLPIPAQKDELFHLTETLNRLLSRIDQGFLEVKRFTADASHELRIPVTVLKGSLDVALRRDRTQEEYRALVTEMRDDVNGLASLVDDLLTLSRADSGGKKLALQPARLDILLADAVAAATALSAGKVQLSLKGTIEREILCDPEALKRALLNLLHNAIKFTPAGGRVSLEASERPDGIEIAVQDSGPGIAPEEQERIFDRFYRTDEARSRDAGGTGLGLAIARTIAVAHHGTLTVRSADGGGSIFRLFLPTPR